MHSPDPTRLTGRLRGHGDTPLSKRERRPQAGARPDRPLLGIALVVLSTIFLASGDVTAKYLASSLPAIQIAWLRFLSFSIIMALIAIATGPRAILRSCRPTLQVIRGLGLVSSALLFISALHHLDVADATAIFFISPFLVMALSRLSLKERVGPKRWAAAAFGLVGVVIILRPNTPTFHVASILPLLAALAWAGTLVITRKMSALDAPETTLLYSALVGLAASSALVPFAWVAPTPRELLLGGLVGILSTAGHAIVVVAYRHADASLLVPYTYGQILWASASGFFLLGAVPDEWTFGGASLIVLSGLYNAAQARVRMRSAFRQ